MNRGLQISYTGGLHEVPGAFYIQKGLYKPLYGECLQSSYSEVALQTPIQKGLCEALSVL